MWARRARARRTSAGGTGRTSARGCDGCHRMSFGNLQAYACPTKGQFNMCNCTGIRDSSRNIRHRPPAARGTARAAPPPKTAREGPAAPSGGPPSARRPAPRTGVRGRPSNAPGARPRSPSRTAPGPDHPATRGGGHGATRPRGPLRRPEGPDDHRSRPEGGKARRRAQGAAEGHEGGRSGALGMADGPRTRPARHGIRTPAPRNPHKKIALDPAESSAIDDASSAELLTCLGVGPVGAGPTSYGAELRAGTRWGTR